jgi:hypothetical protein
MSYVHLSLLLLLPKHAKHDTYLDILVLLDTLPRVWVILSVNLDFRMSSEQVDYITNHLETTLFIYGAFLRGYL